METTSFSAAIFDLDGTLADTLADIAASMNHALSAHGLPTHEPGEYRRMVGEGLAVLASRAIPPGRQELSPSVIAGYREHHSRHFADQTTAYPGAVELLDALLERGVPSAVLSNKDDDFARAVVTRLFGRHRFAFVGGSRPELPRKPDPSQALEVARTLGVDPRRCAFVGDTPIDMETARAAGMYPVGVLWGFRGREELSRSGAKALLLHPLDLLAVQLVQA
ncbi:MAG: HAD family hydrolase [Myxococcales bacterium]|nr:HAD family hydrolase [Myxococcales bacterium]